MGSRVAVDLLLRVGVYLARIVVGYTPLLKSRWGAAPKTHVLLKAIYVFLSRSPKPQNGSKMVEIKLCCKTAVKVPSASTLCTRVHTTVVFSK